MNPPKPRGAQPGNDNAAKPLDQRRTDQFSLRTAHGLKARCVRAANKTNRKLNDWCEEALVEKCQREEQARD